MNELKEYLEQYPEAKILDIGTGKGDFINLIDYLYHDYSEIIGVDVIDYLLEMDKDSFKDNPKIRFVNEDILNPTFPKKSFDIVSLSSTFHHLTDIEGTLKYMASLLKPGGIIIISELISDNLDKQQVSHELLHHFAAKIIREIGMIHSQTCNKEDILKTVKKYAPIPVIDYWDMTIKDFQLDVELSQLYQVINQLLENVRDSDRFEVFKNEADEIKSYLKKNGFQLANKLCIVLKKV